MNGTLEEPSVWSAQKRALVIAVAVAAQVVLIYWFSEKAPLRPRTADVRPAIQLIASAHNELLSLKDPTLFARAHPQGFSGPAWLTIPDHSYLPPEEQGEPLWLSPPRETLGATFQQFVKNYPSDGATIRRWQPPAVTAPTISPSFFTIPPSQVRIEGPLAARGLIAVPKLPAWTNADILAPSRVQVLVDARGNPISAVLLNSSGLKAADQRAVEIARDLTFGADQEALIKHPHDADAGLTTGWVIFSWRTLAPPNTNIVINPR